MALKVIKHICFSPIDSVFYRGRFSAKRLKANYLPDISIKIIEDLLDKLGENKELVEYCREGCSKRSPAEQKNTNIDYYENKGNYVSKVDIQTELWARGKIWKKIIILGILITSIIIMGYSKKNNSIDWGFLPYIYMKREEISLTVKWGVKMKKICLWKPCSKDFETVDRMK